MAEPSENLKKVQKEISNGAVKKEALNSTNIEFVKSYFQKHERNFRDKIEKNSKAS